MKRIILALLLSFPLCMFAQNVAEDVKQEIERLRDVVFQKYENEKYVSAIDTAQKVIDTIESSGYDSVDSTLRPFLYVVQARCYFRNEQWQKAVDATKKAIEIYGKNVSTDDETYHNYMDNLSLYLPYTDKLDEALDWNMKAASYFEKNNLRNENYAGVMLHRADIYCGKKEYDKALAAQMITIDIEKEVNGIHSEEFINELDFLKDIYDYMGDSVNVKKLDNTIQRLQAETNYGYIPENQDVQTAEQAHNSLEDALMCSRFVLNHYINSEEWSEASKYVLNWLTVSPDVNLFVSEAEGPWLNDKKGAIYLSAYMAAWIEYAIKEKDKEQSYDAYSSAIVDLLNFYTANKHLSGEVKAFDDYIELYNKSDEKFFELLRKNYDTYHKTVEKLDDEQKRNIKVTPEMLKPNNNHTL